MHRAPTIRRTRFLAALLVVMLLLENISLAGIPHARETPTAAAADRIKNGRIAFHSNRVTPLNPEGDYEIFSMKPNGGDLDQLTSNAIDDRWPAWSPSGTKIAFARGGSDAGFDHIYVMDADGSFPTQLTSGSGFDAEPTWAPGGGGIAFSRLVSGRRHIFKMQSDGSNQTQLTTTGNLNSGPQWSPDGNKIAFGTFAGIMTMNDDGSNQAILIPEAGSPSWSPDGAKIAYAARGQGLANSDIFVANADGTNPVNLTNNPAPFEGDPAWSPEGDQIVFVRAHEVNNAGYGEIYRMRADGSQQTRLTSNEAIDEGPSWQLVKEPRLPPAVIGPPKFLREQPIVFVSDRRTPDNPEGDLEIFTMGTTVLAGAPRQLTFNTVPDLDPAWSPSGAKIAFVSHRDGNSEIFTMNADGSNPIRLTTGSDDRGPTWSPDGAKIAFTRFTSSSARDDIYVMQADGSNATLVTSGAGSPDWSPDGSKIALTRACGGFSGCIWTMNSDGAGLKLLTSQAEAGSIDPAWSPNGAKIAFARCPATGVLDLLNCGIHVMNADGSNQRRLTTAPPPTSGALVEGDTHPRWSPEGELLVFMRTDHRDTSEIVTIKANGTSLSNRTNNPADDESPDWSPKSGGQAQAAARADNDRKGAQVKDKKHKDKNGKKDKKNHQNPNKKKRGPYANDRGATGRGHGNRGDKRGDGTGDRNGQRHKHGQGG